MITKRTSDTVVSEDRNCDFVGPELLCRFFPSPLAREQQVRELVPQLRDSNAGNRQTSVDRLGSLGAHAVASVPALLPLLGDEMRSVRLATAHVLGKFGPLAVAAVPELVRMLNARDEEAFLAAEALARIEPSAKCAPVLARSLPT